MSRPLCSLRTSLRLPKLSNGSPFVPPRTVSTVRRYSYAALKTRPESGPRDTPQRAGPRRQKAVTEDEDDFDSRGMAALGSTSNWTSSSITEASSETVNTHNRKTSKEDVSDSLAEHLNGLFPPLQFPPDLARRVLTHGSHPSAVNGHNAGLRFIGRRVIESYLLLFLQSSTALKATHDLDAILDRTINTYLLGEHVGSSWGLGRALRWTPAVPASQLSSTPDSEKLLRGVGFYKVQGDAVAAVMGGIYYQFGATLTQRVFHTHILPKLLLERRPEGLPDVFHAEALAMCERMGGPNAQLMADASAKTVETVSN
ncbi:hypothetical protein JOM56_011861 [Amanita muscaria]